MKTAFACLVVAAATFVSARGTPHAAEPVAPLSVPPSATPVKIKRAARELVVTVRVKKAPGATFERTPKHSKGFIPGQTPKIVPMPTESGVILAPASERDACWSFQFSDAHLALLNEAMEKNDPGDVELKWDLGFAPAEALPQHGWKVEATTVVWTRRGGKTSDLATCVSDGGLTIEK
jgi:hypothetical protein